MKRKVLAMVLALALVFSMTACGGSKKEDKKEDPKKQETQVESEKQEVVETPEELNEYGVTDEEMQLLLDRFKEKIKENEEFYKNYDNFFEQGNEMSEMFFTGLACLTSVDEFLENTLKGREDNVETWVLFLEAVKDWKEGDGVSEEKSLEFLKTIGKNWEVFRDTELKPAYDEAIGTIR